MKPKRKKITYISFDKYLKEQLKDRKFREAYEKEGRRLEVAYQINRLRKKQRLSQKALAKKLDTTQSVIARIETGQQNFTVDTLQRIASALKCNLKIEFVR